MLDRICTTFLALGDPERCAFYADYNQWKNALKPEVKEEKKKVKPVPSPSPKLSSAERNEYKRLEEKILAAEKELAQHHVLLEQDEICLNPTRLDQVCQAIALLENQIEQFYLRWYELENKLSNQ